MTESSIRVALVIGAGSGLGLAAAAALEADGCRVVTADLVGASTEVDVTDEASVANLFDDVLTTEGRLDVVVTTAGVSTLSLVADHDAADFRRVLDVNLTGSMLVFKHAARTLGPGGSITALTSLNARQPGAGLAAYCAAKAGLAMLVEVTALELGPRGIRVNAVAPGLVATPLTAPALQIDGIEADYLANTPLGRAGTPDEVAEAVVYATRAAWLTGTTLDLNGGAHLRRYPDLVEHVTRAFG